MKEAMFRSIVPWMLWYVPQTRFAIIPLGYRRARLDLALSDSIQLGVVSFLRCG